MHKYEIKCAIHGSNIRKEMSKNWSNVFKTYPTTPNQIYLKLKRLSQLNEFRICTGTSISFTENLWLNKRNFACLFEVYFSIKNTAISPENIGTCMKHGVTWNFSFVHYKSRNSINPVYLDNAKYHNFFLSQLKHTHWMQSNWHF